MKIGDKIQLIKGGEITVKSFRDTDEGYVVVDTEGNIYLENELNLRYKLSPEYILYNVLYNNNIDTDEYDASFYKNVFEEFMEQMMNSGYVKAKPED